MLKIQFRIQIFLQKQYETLQTGFGILVTPPRGIARENE